MVFTGIDVGTQGARVVACDEQGDIVAHAEEAFDWQSGASLPAGWFEQDPLSWWDAVVICLRRLSESLRTLGRDPADAGGLSVTSTSGTVVLVDGSGAPLGPALMYNDGRAQAEAAEVNRVGAALAGRLGYRFAASFALPKLLWLQRHEPERFSAARYLISPTDFIIGRLTGRYDLTDYSNALKTGYDLVDDCWPTFIEAGLGIPQERLPAVLAPGARIGEVMAAAAAATGLAAGTPVLAGMTDGCASQVSTGAVAPGQWNSTLGTTLVIKGVTRRLLKDPAGRVYCHRHPDGYWLPGGASNTGGECIARRFDAARRPELNAGALACAPTGLLVYPLTRTGERFPFNRPGAEGFAVDLGDGRTTALDAGAVSYTAHLEGVAYVERLAYDVLAGLGAKIGDAVAGVGDAIYVAGGGNQSAAWLQLRADILGRCLRVPVDGGGAKGAAILAAAGVYYHGLLPAARAMVSIEREVTPRPALKAAYDERYARFCAECRSRGYLD